MKHETKNEDGINTKLGNEKTSPVVEEQEKSSKTKITLNEEELAEIINKAIERVRTPR